MLTRSFPPFPTVIWQESQLLTDEMRELLAGVTRATINDLEEKTPFGATARARGDATAEYRWLHLRGSAHSTSLLRNMMNLAEEAASSLDSVELCPTSSLDAQADSNAEDLSNIMLRAQNIAQLPKKSTPEPAAAKGSKSKGLTAYNANSPFSWSTYLKSAEPNSPDAVIAPTPQRRKGANASENSIKATSPPPSQASPGPVPTPNGTKASATGKSTSNAPLSTHHRKLSASEMATFGMLPLEDEYTLLRCPTCQRILMEHIYLTHTARCRTILQHAEIAAPQIEAQKLAPTPPPGSEFGTKTTFNAYNTQPTSMNSFAPQGTAQAKVQISRSSTPKSQSPAPRQAASYTPPPQQPHQQLVYQQSNSTSFNNAAPPQMQPKMGFGVHPRSQSQPTLSSSSSPAQNTNTNARYSQATSMNLTHASPLTNNRTQSPTTSFSNPPRPTAPSATSYAPNSSLANAPHHYQATSTPQASPMRVSQGSQNPAPGAYVSSPGGSILVTSPRAGLRASVGTTGSPPGAVQGQTYTYLVNGQPTYSGNTSNATSSPMVHSSSPQPRNTAKRGREDSIMGHEQPIAVRPTPNDELYAANTQFSPKRVSYGVPPSGPSPSRSINSGRNSTPPTSNMPGVTSQPVNRTAYPTHNIQTAPPKRGVAASGPSKRPAPAPNTHQVMPMHVQLNYNTAPSQGNWAPSNNAPNSTYPMYRPAPQQVVAPPPPVQNDMHEAYNSPFALAAPTLDPDYAMFVDDFGADGSFFPPASADDPFR